VVKVPIIVDPEQSKARLSKEITLLSLALLNSAESLLVQE